MPELRLTRTLIHLHVQLDGREAPVAWAPFAALAGDQELLVRDPVAYGRALYQLTFGETGLSTVLESLPTSARLLVVSDDPLINAAGWEYLRTADNSLLAARLSLVRAGPPVQRPPSANFTLPAPPARLKIMAVVASPIDETSPLNTEGEWKRLQQVTKQAGKALTLTRVRPPTPAKLSRTLDPSACNVIHFMGHSNSKQGRSVLLFENERGSSQLVTAEDFTDQLDASVVLVVLNSCRSAVAEAEWTEFGNLARGLVGRGVPYALGMRALLPDAAALEITDAFYAYLLQGRSIEESVRRVRAGLTNNAILPDTAWLAGLPVLYSSQPASEPALSLLSLLVDGEPTINPDPTLLEAVCDLTAIPAAAHFVGRVSDTGDALDALTTGSQRTLVVIHGLGGMGKTALARAIAERASWFFGDRALALSFETFAHMAGPIRQVDSSFAGRFFARLARFYGLDPADGQRYPTPESLQEGILQQRKVRSSLLVLDNLETLLDVLEQGDTTAKTQARTLAAFLARLHEGDGAVLLTTRIMPPPDWGHSQLIHLNGLEDTAGAALFWELLPASRRTNAPLPDRIALSQRVQGHPVSLRLLAGRFGQGVEELAAFLVGIEQTLRTAEQNTPASLADPERQSTLYACMAYSVERLTPAQREILRRVSIFRSPFPVEYGVQIAADSVDGDELPERLAPEDAERLLQDLVRLGLLESEERMVSDSSLILYDLHAMLRWYVAEALPAPEAGTFTRYALTMAGLALRAYEDFDRYAWLRMLVSNMAADLDAALSYLSPPERSRIAYHLALPYQRLGLIRRALELYEEALEIHRAENDLRSIAVTQHSMADVLLQMGQPQAALALYQEALDTTKTLGDVREIAMTQSSMADVLRQMGQPQAALALYQEALDTLQALGDVRGIAVTQSSMAAVLSQMGQPQVALALYQEALDTSKALGDVRGIAVTQSSMAAVLSQMGQPQTALALHQEALDTTKALGDVRSTALTQSNMAAVLRQMGQPQAALALYQEALDSQKALGDVRSIAVTESSMADVLLQMGQPQAALALYQEALDTTKALGDVQGIAVTQSNMAAVLSQMGQPQAALALHQEALDTKKALGDVGGIAVTQSSMADVLRQTGQPQAALALYREALDTTKALGDVRSTALTQHSMADVLGQMGQPQAALALYREALDTSKALGDVRSIAVTQHSIADVLRQMGQPQTALGLYQEALDTKKALGDVREIASTQSSMADVLSQMGQPQAALALYQEALDTKKALGDVLSIAVTQSNMAAVLSQMGQPQAALALYQEALDTKKAIGDVLSIAVTQSNMAAVLSQMGQPQAALALYQEALATTKALGDVRSTALTQHSMADVLGQMGQPQAALALYQEALDTSKALGDVRSIAVTQANFGQFLLQEGEPQRSLEMFWAAYTALSDAGYAADAAAARDLLVDAKTQVLGVDRFDALWLALGAGAQPAWLAEAQATPPSSFHLPPDQQRILVANTVAVLTTTSENLAEWRTVIEAARQDITGDELADLAAFYAAILSLLNGEPAALPTGNEYHALWQAIIDGVTGNKPQNLLDILVNNTLAVLGPAAAQRAKWQSDLEQLQSQAIAEGERGLADLVETVLALLAASGNPSGLGAGLEGPFAQAWQEIVAKLGH